MSEKPSHPAETARDIAQRRIRARATAAARPPLSLAEAQEARLNLECTIRAALNDFVRATGLRVEGVELVQQIDGGIVWVTVEVRL